MKNTPPNILWLCTDQQRFDTLGCAGNQDVNTPNIDRLAERGVMFSHAYCQSPICTPSRGSFLTGRYPRTTRLRMNGAKMPADEVLVTKILADNGYRCGLAGKFHLAPCQNRVEERIDDGYSVWHWSHEPCPAPIGGAYLDWLEEKGAPWNTTYPIPPEKSSQLGFSGIGPDGETVWSGMPKELHQSRWCAEKAVEFMDENKDRPWLFSVNFFDPHHPFDPPKEFMDRYDPADIPSPRYVEGELANKPIYQQIDHRGATAGKGISFADTTDLEHREIIGSYYAMIENLDENIGFILDGLEATGQADNTLIIFMSDHGEMLGSHGIFLKGPYMYDEAVRVPMIFSMPEHFLKGVRSDALVELIDIAPTILELAGIDIPERIQGKSLVPISTGHAPLNEHRNHVYSEYYNCMEEHVDAGLPAPYVTMFRDYEYKIVIYLNQELGELYDLTNDPGEHSNLWNNPEFLGIKCEYLKKCCDASVETMDPLPLRIAKY